MASIPACAARAAASACRRTSMRSSALSARIEADTARLASVEARLRALQDGATSTHDRAQPPFAIKPLESVRLAQLTAVTQYPVDVGTLAAGLYARLEQRLADADIVPAGPRVSYQRSLGQGRLKVHAAVVLGQDTDVPAGVEEARLPAVAEAACLRVAGTVQDFDADARTLAWWLQDNGYRYRLDEPVREVHLVCTGDSTRSVVEMQMPVEPAR